MNTKFAISDALVIKQRFNSILQYINWKHTDSYISAVFWVTRNQRNFLLTHMELLPNPRSHYFEVIFQNLKVSRDHTHVRDNNGLYKI